MDNTFLRQLLIDEEGIELAAYKDSEGIWTIGIGHNLENEQSEEELAVFGLGDDLPDDLSKISITEQQAYDLFDIDVNDAIDTMPDDFTPAFLETIGEHRRAVLVSMCFQIGSINKWKSMLNAIRESDWDRAADEMLWSNGLTKVKRSAWYRQTRQRCERAADAMRVGYFERYQEQKVEPTYRIPAATMKSTLLAECSVSELLGEIGRRLNRA